MSKLESVEYKVLPFECEAGKVPGHAVLAAVFKGAPDSFKHASVYATHVVYEVFASHDHA